MKKETRRIYLQLLLGPAPVASAAVIEKTRVGIIIGQASISQKWNVTDISDRGGPASFIWLRHLVTRCIAGTQDFSQYRARMFAQ